MEEPPAQGDILIVEDIRSSQVRFDRSARGRGPPRAGGSLWAHRVHFRLVCSLRMSSDQVPNPPWGSSPKSTETYGSVLGAMLSPLDQPGRSVREWVGREDRSPGRVAPGITPWSSHRSRRADYPHRARHLRTSLPARSVGFAVTRVRSQCTCHGSSQRLMRRHPLPSPGSLRLVPLGQQYYETLRLPAAHFAALRFLRLAIPSLRPLFVPPGPGRGAVDQAGVGGRYLRPPCSMETAGSPKFPGESL